MLFMVNHGSYSFMVVSGGTLFKGYVFSGEGLCFFFRNVSFPHEAIRGSDFFSAQVDAFPYHEWPKATSDREMHQRVLTKSRTRELPHVEKAFSNVAINKLVNLKITWKLKNFPCKIEKFVKSQCSKSQMIRRKSLNGRSVFNIHATSSGPARGANEFGCHF